MSTSPFRHANCNNGGGVLTYPIQEEGLSGVQNMRPATFGTVLIAFATCCPAVFAAEVSSKSAVPIVESLLKAGDRPPDPQTVRSAAQKRLTSSLARLDQFLKASGAKVQSGWNRYLDLPVLKSELSRSQPDLPALQAINKRFYQNYPGLEMSAFVAVRDDLRGYVTACEY